MSERVTLRLWLWGPLQAWGTASRFEIRGTELAPSKSGVIGMLCAALGRGRGEPVDDLAALRFGVRVERRGSVLRDYHTVGAGTDAVAVANAGTGRGIVTQRFYLEDAAFVAGLEGADRARAEELRQALEAPRWPLSLGRRSCPPAGPVVDQLAVYDGPLEAALADAWCPLPRWQRSSGEVELLVEAVRGELVLDDQPAGAAYQHRSFKPRRVTSTWIERDAT